MKVTHTGTDGSVGKRLLCKPKDLASDPGTGVKNMKCNVRDPTQS